MDEGDDLHDEQSNANENRSKSFDGSAVYPPACYNLMPEYDPAQKKMLKALSKQDSEEGAKELKSIVGNLWKAKFRKGQDSSSPSSSSSEDVEKEARVRVRKKKKGKRRRSTTGYSMLNDMGSRHESDDSEGEDAGGSDGTSFSPMSTVIKEPTSSRKVKSSEEPSSFRRDRNGEASPVLPERIRASSKLMKEAANSESADMGLLTKRLGSRKDDSLAMTRQQSVGSLSVDVGKVKRKQFRGRMVRKQQSVGNLYERPLSPVSRSPSPMNKIVDEILQNKKEQIEHVAKPRPTVKRQFSREYFSDMDTPHSPRRRGVGDILMDNQSLRENSRHGHGRNNNSMELDSSLHQMVGRFFKEDNADQNVLHDDDTGSSTITGLELLTKPNIDSVEDVENDVFTEDDDDLDSPLSQQNSLSSLNLQFGGSGLPEMPILQGNAIEHHDRSDDHGSESGESWNSKERSEGSEEPLKQGNSPPSSPVRSLSEGSSLGSPAAEHFDIYIHDDGSPERLSPWGSISSAQMQKSSGSMQTLPSVSPLERSRSDSLRSGNSGEFAVSLKKEVSVHESLPTKSSSGSYHSRESIGGMMSDTSLDDDDSDEEPIILGLSSLIPSSRRAVSSFAEGESGARHRSFDRRPGSTKVPSDDVMYKNKQRRWSFTRQIDDEAQTAHGNGNYDEEDFMTSVRSLPDRIKREPFDRRASMGSSYAGGSSKSSMSNVVDEILTANDWVADYGAWKKERALQTRRKIVSNQSTQMLQRQSSFGHLYGPRMSSSDDKEMELSLEALKIERGRIASTKAESLLTVKTFDGRSSSSDAPRRKRTTRREIPRRCKSGANLQFPVSAVQGDDD